MPRTRFRRRELQLHKDGYARVIGVDEAGRGCLAGPLSIAGVLYCPKLVKYKDLADSKLLSVKKREGLFEQISVQSTYAHVFIHSDEIDQIGLSAAIKKGIAKIVASLVPDFTLIDGNSTWSCKGNAEAIIKGDQKIRSIAAASIIAKVARDRYMYKQALNFPEYHFASHVGYGTRKHLLALHEHGPCKLHRLSFAPVKDSLIKING